MQTRERAHCARSVFPFIKKKGYRVLIKEQYSKMVKVSCRCQSEHSCQCNCVMGSGVSAGSPETDISLQKICSATDILNHLPVNVATI